ncbi:MAG: ABC transporter substrate-binding protein [Defluviitaleaceae bacterium]|nr:ABC transporter substrate-binding protein [Defluviitaleaceae bacterium]MCL2239728.1 ABC transporter substrate-binding protein [Defluviitaleaceae bacterium]
MKRVIALCLAVLMLAAVGFMTSCGRSDTEIVFGWWGGDGRAEQTQRIIDLFVEGSDNVDYIEPVIASWGEYWEMMLTRAAAGDLPCVMQQDTGRMIEFQAAGLLQDLRPLIADGRLDVTNIPQMALEAGMVPGSSGIYAIPTGMNVTAMTYNATLLRELGLSAPLNMTLDQFIDLSREIYARSGVRTNWIGADPSIQLEIHLRAQGVNLFDFSGPTPRMGGSPANYVEFFQVIAMGIEEGWHIRPEHLAGREGAEMTPLWYPPGDEREFANMRQWNDPIWSNMLTGQLNDAPDWMEIGMTSFPSNNPQRASFGRSTMFLAITTQADDLDASAEFLNWFINSVEAYTIMGGDRGVAINPVIARAIDPILAVPAQRQAAHVAWTNDGNSSPFFAGRPEGAAEVVGTNGELVRITDLVATGAMTPQEAAEAFFAFGNATVR